MKRIVGITFALVVLLVLAWEISHFPYLGVRGKIAIARRYADHPHIYAINVLGFPLKRLSNITGYSPSWSPSGDRLVYECRFKETITDVCIVNADGSKQERLTFATRSIEYGSPHWSPIGEAILLIGYPDGPSSELFIIKPDASELTQVTHNGSMIITPSWSPDGEKIAFAMDDQDGKSEIYIINKDGSNQVRITDNPSNDLYPNWSRDGKYIFFESERTGNWEIYRVNIDGSGLINLTNNPLEDNDPNVSPDGQHITYIVRHHAEPFGDDIYIMNIDGTGRKQLTNTPDHEEVGVTWSSDGQNIAFVSDQGEGGHWALYVMKADGRWPRRITFGDSIGFLDYPVWQP